MKGKALVVFSFLFLFSALSVLAQGNTKFSVAYLVEDLLDVSASDISEYSRKDANGNYYAIFKVKAGNVGDDVSAYKFDFGTYAHEVHTVKNKLWIYVQGGASKVTISRDGYETLADFSLHTTVIPGRVYDMTLLASSSTFASAGELQFKVTPSNIKAVVMYKEEFSDGEYQELGVTVDGVLTKNVEPGAYLYRVSADLYKDSEGRVELADDRSGYMEVVTLTPTFSNVVIKTDEGADIYIDGLKKGTGVWSGRLDAGEYYVDCKKKGHKMLQENIVIPESCDTTITFPPLEAIYGEFTMFSSPSGAKVTIDGNTFEQSTPGYFKWYSGSYKVQVSKEGYDTAEVEIEVVEDEIREYSVTLKKYVPKQVGRGDVYSSSSKVGTAVDLGLPSGLKWATCNIGAAEPWEYGDYFSWGEIFTKGSYKRSNSETYDLNIDDISGSAQYDAATAKWGVSWRMPTASDFRELINNCKWTWITFNGVDGYEVRGKNNNYIFLPAAGYCDDSTVAGDREGGCYFSATPHNSAGNAYYLQINMNDRVVDWYERCIGFSVRPVSDK